MTKRNRFWENLILAVGAVPQEHRSIRGASGLEHPLLAMGIDEAHRRLIVISLEQDARATILVQTDIQMALKDMQVVVARPVLVSFPKILKPNDITDEFADSIPVCDRMGDLMEEIRVRINAVFPSDETTYSWEEMHCAEFRRLYISLIASSHGAIDEKIKLRLVAAVSEDPIARDRNMGGCAIPIYSFSPNEFNVLCQTEDVNATREILRRENILQYFFPPADQLALGLVDRNQSSHSSELVDLVNSAPNMGHPFGKNEIVEASSVKEVVDELLERKFIIEGEITMELGPKGENVRKTVRFKPREGLLSKLVNRISVSLNLKDLINW